jgi:hypothetical protein
MPTGAETPVKIGVRRLILSDNLNHGTAQEAHLIDPFFF